MNLSVRRKIARALGPVCTATLAVTAAFGQVPRTLAPAAQQIISLVQDESPQADQATRVRGDASFDNPPTNFRSFASVRAGEIGDLEKLTLGFSASTKLTRIESTKDFVVEQGSTCVEGREFAEHDTCVLLVRFDPQGAGRRLGKLTITHSASPEPMNLGLGGNGFAPVVSFIPALMTTVAATAPSGKGLLSGTKNLSVDGSDALYMADSGNGIVRYLDSSGAITSLASGYTGVWGVAVDSFGEVYFDVPSSNTMYEIYDYGPVVEISGTGTTGCTASSPCNLENEAVITPQELSVDSDNDLFWVDGHEGAAFSTVQPLPAKLIFLYDPFDFQTNPAGPLATDSEDNLYSLWANGNECELVQQNLYDAENGLVAFNKVAGGRTCGFAGDGGQAGNAEIGNAIGQIAFDLAGDLYFSDTSNQRVRRIDYETGQIHTIAGTGVAGYTGDGTSALLARLSSPTGVTVDSQGQVYIVSSATTGQVVRKLGPNGMLSFGAQLKSIASAAQLVTVSNTGNSSLTLTNIVITGTNPGDFSIDPTTTSCMLTAGSTLNAGQSCKIGVLFKPAAIGARSANLVMLDNTVTNSNTVELAGTGTLPAPTFTITSPASGASVTAGTAVTFKVSVTSSTTPAPTGKVTMTLDGTAITGSPVALSSGVASLSVTSSVVGTHTLAATYSGDSNYAAAGPISETYKVTAAAASKGKTATILKSSVNPATVCKPVTFTSTVDGNDGGKPTGDVEIWNGSILLGTATLKNGSATLSTSWLPAGTNMLKATYVGDQTHEASASTELKQVVGGQSKASACEAAK
jgi:Bacterial Ig-like domain (group 3)